MPAAPRAQIWPPPTGLAGLPLSSVTTPSTTWAKMPQRLKQPLHVEGTHFSSFSVCLPPGPLLVLGEHPSADKPVASKHAPAKKPLRDTQTASDIASPFSSPRTFARAILALARRLQKYISRKKTLLGYAKGYNGVCLGENVAPFHIARKDVLDRTSLLTFSRREPPASANELPVSPICV